MPSPIEPRTLKRLYRMLSEKERVEAARAFFESADKKSAERQEADRFLCERLKFRPKMLRTLPDEKKARLLAGHLKVDPSYLLLERLLTSFHLRHRRSILEDFLDALGVKHDDGSYGDDAFPDPPTEERLRAASSSLREKYPLDHVYLYLAVLGIHDPDGTWIHLAPILQDLDSERGASSEA